MKAEVKKLNTKKKEVKAEVSPDPKRSQKSSKGSKGGGRSGKAKLRDKTNIKTSPEKSKVNSIKNYFKLIQPTLNSRGTEFGHLNHPKEKIKFDDPTSQLTKNNQSGRQEINSHGIGGTSQTGEQGWTQTSVTDKPYSSTEIDKDE